MKARTKMAEIMREFPEAYKWGRGLRDLRLLIGQKPRNFETEVCVLIGPAGGGKGRWAASRDGSRFCEGRGEGWDGHDRENTVVMDDFYGWLPFCELLRLTDCYPHNVPMNGMPAFVEFTSKKIIMTSNKMPDQWYGEQST